jgi:hypothetical protein
LTVSGSRFSRRIGGQHPDGVHGALVQLGPVFGESLGGKRARSSVTDADAAPFSFGAARAIIA